MTKKGKTIIGITMGDAVGIGPEVICKMFLRKSYRKFCDVVLVGDKFLFDKTIQHYRISMKTEKVNNPEDVFLLPEHILGVMDIESRSTISSVVLGRPSREIGAAALASVDKAVDLARKNKIDAMVTAPLNKEIVALSHRGFVGHTEHIAGKLKVAHFNMMMVSAKMRVILVTTHMALKNVAKNITRDRLKHAIQNGSATLQKLGYRKPRMAVLGLNPHSSDGGLFGDEEERVIIPVIEDMKEQGIHCEGPFPPDTFFSKYMRYPVYDLIVTMYHDQALIPFKMTSFGIGINVTVGLPVIRASVDHGTAYDIAGKNMANDRSLFEAVKFASHMAGASV